MTIKKEVEKLKNDLTQSVKKLKAINEYYSGMLNAQIVETHNDDWEESTKRAMQNTLHSINPRDMLNVGALNSTRKPKIIKVIIPLGKLVTVLTKL